LYGDCRAARVAVPAGAAVRVPAYPGDPRRLTLHDFSSRPKQLRGRGNLHDFRGPCSVFDKWDLQLPMAGRRFFFFSRRTAPAGASRRPPKKKTSRPKTGITARPMIDQGFLLSIAGEWNYPERAAAGPVCAAIAYTRRRDRDWSRLPSVGPERVREER